MKALVFCSLVSFFFVLLYVSKLLFSYFIELEPSRNRCTCWSFMHIIQYTFSAQVYTWQSLSYIFSKVINSTIQILSLFLESGLDKDLKHV